MEDHSSEVVKTSEVIGKKVISPDKEDLGNIEELVLTKISGEVRYAVLSFGGFMGLGDKYFAIPWKAISFDPEENAFILKVNKEKLKNAPGFDKDNWPNMANWEQAVSSYYSGLF